MFCEKKSQLNKALSFWFVTCFETSVTSWCDNVTIGHPSDPNCYLHLVSCLFQLHSLVKMMSIKSVAQVTQCHLTVHAEHGQAQLVFWAKTLCTFNPGHPRRLALHLSPSPTAAQIDIHQCLKAVIPLQFCHLLRIQQSGLLTDLTAEAHRSLLVLPSHTGELHKLLDDTLQAEVVVTVWQQNRFSVEIFAYCTT